MQCLCELGGFCNRYLAVGKVTLGGNSSQGLKSTFFRSKNLIYKLSSVVLALRSFVQGEIKQRGGRCWGWF